MNILKRIRFRWNNNRDALPGETEPTRDGAILVWFSTSEDVEKNPCLRKLRGLITGYGEAWTFTKAMRSWLLKGW